MAENENSENEVIVLDRLLAATLTDGLRGVTAVKVEAPVACSQPNAKGNLRSFSSLDEFRECAEKAGRDFRKALVG